MHQLLQCIDRHRLLQVHCKALLSAQEVSEQCSTLQRGAEAIKRSKEAACMSRLSTIMFVVMTVR